MNERQNEEREDLDPYEINFLPEFLEGRGPRQPFINSHGVLIGDHEYASANSPLEQWSTETDPAIMSGDEWVHPFKDIGFHSAGNRAIFEDGEEAGPGFLNHPVQDSARVYGSQAEENPGKSGAGN